jgi:uncharacterized membrane protein YvbJ
VVVTLIAGQVTKKYPNIDKKKVIPIQNLIIGIIIAVVDWIITKDFNAAIAASGLLAGGVYDLVSNLSLLGKGDE